MSDQEKPNTVSAVDKPYEFNREPVAKGPAVNYSDRESNVSSRTRTRQWPLYGHS